MRLSPVQTWAMFALIAVNCRMWYLYFQEKAEKRKESNNDQQ